MGKVDLRDKVDNYSVKLVLTGKNGFGRLVKLHPARIIGKAAYSGRKAVVYGPGIEARCGIVHISREPGIVVLTEDAEGNNVVKIYDITDIWGWAYAVREKEEMTGGKLEINV